MIVLLSADYEVLDVVTTEQARDMGLEAVVDYIERDRFKFPGWTPHIVFRGAAMLVGWGPGRMAA
ncbi:hypothetical protein [Labilithrix luteola]|uniref:hypothetical protein n=1 Tax=Labilithrix luteola TaxID=1391654 RepID=UPI0011BAD092|nr:hypothetical protein [Labilithrix luteola]